MESLSLTVDKREDKELGNNASRRLRRENYIPGVLYGLAKEPITLKIDAQQFSQIIKGKGTANLIFNLSVNGSKKKESVILKDIQKHPITRNFLHLDFLRIEMAREVEAQVPIHILNDDIAIGVKEEGGVMQHSLRELHIACLPKDIPESIDYDIRELAIGDSVKVSDLEVGENIRVISDLNEVIVSIIHPSQLIEEEVEEEVEEEPELIGREGEEEEAEEADAKAEETPEQE
ncbi:MAG: 50S ribosomal protein L25 [Actinomycetia bacterium]|nr:50S ribosomal protein L25 [Actinomycetes bacterium]